MSTKTPAVPRPSASLVVINERHEVLLVQRNPKASTFAGVHVFPGGNFDKKQDTSLQMTAIRETFEESGILLASPASAIPDGTVLEAARDAIHSQKMTFGSFLEEHKLQADVDALLPFTEWITPIEVPRRFRARLYVAFLPSSSSGAGFTSGQKEEQIPTPDGGQEVISARFLTPAAWLSEFREGKITFMPPQYYVLYTLAGLESLAQVEELARGQFGKMVLNARRVQAESGVYTYGGDETRGGPKGRRHRVRCALSKGGITTKIELERNFDIFTEIEPCVLELCSNLGSIAGTCIVLMMFSRCVCVLETRGHQYHRIQEMW